MGWQGLVPLDWTHIRLYPKGTVYTLHPKYVFLLWIWSLKGIYGERLFDEKWGTSGMTRNDNGDRRIVIGSPQSWRLQRRSTKYILGCYKFAYNENFAIEHVLMLSRHIARNQFNTIFLITKVHKDTYITKTNLTRSDNNLLLMQQAVKE